MRKMIKDFFIHHFHGDMIKVISNNIVIKLDWFGTLLYLFHQMCVLIKESINYSHT